MSSISAVQHAQTHAASGGGNEYTVQHGDTLSAIAAQHGVSLAALEAANPQIRNPNVIYPGDRIAIPSGGGSTHSAGSSAHAGGTYTVQHGDTLSA
ncbi:MAG TPA: LysM peptidoglycan-binding domain-containing protein, partial [Dokdonella sp.]